jgi:cyanophycinase-like exopeptidase
MQDSWSNSPREIAIDEKSAVLVEPDGSATVVGSGMGAYFIRPTRPPAVCQAGKPLAFQNISVHEVPTGGHFDLKSWKADGGTTYALSVEKGKVESTQAAHGLY